MLKVYQENSIKNPENLRVFGSFYPFSKLCDEQNLPLIRGEHRERQQTSAPCPCAVAYGVSSTSVIVTEPSATSGTPVRLPVPQAPALILTS